jgi:hypothetical protein
MPRAPRSGTLVCPSCGTSYPAHERFCAGCKMPLTYPEAPHSDDVVSDRHARARKVKPQLSEGELVRVAGASNQAEAEFIQGMLLEEGVPSMLRRSAGFDVPDFLAAGPRDVLVPQAGVATARQVLLEAELITPDAGRPAVVAPGRLLVGLLIALAIAAAIVWLITELVR